MTFHCKSINHYWNFAGNISHKGSTGEIVGPKLINMMHIDLQLEIIQILYLFEDRIKIILTNEETDVRKRWHII